MKAIGIDVGFGFTKATVGNENVIFKSLLGDSNDIQFRSAFGDSSLTKNLHVTLGDKSYFIGEFAEQQSTVRQFTLDQDKLLSEYVKVLALTSVGLCSDSDTSFNVVSGLPVGYLKRDYKRFNDIIAGHHSIVYHTPDGEKISKKIFINKVKMMPQPLGSVFNLIMDDNGKISDTDLTRKKIGVVDIGFRTTDFTIINNMQYVERGSSTMDTGISKSFSVIATKLRKESGVNVEIYRLFDAIESGSIKIRGKEYNITNLRDKVFAHSASSIATDINRLWSEDWDIDCIVLTGGGAMEMAKHLQPLIEGNVIPLNKSIDARLNNVQGYLKFAKSIWNNASAPPDLPEEKAEEKKKP
ncbi:MAG: ParM/StbA family protein [Proteobacteria bacterium]|nr:ParM/StbA family protein [Pseudomonadota bacterium]